MLNSPSASNTILLLTTETETCPSNGERPIAVSIASLKSLISFAALSYIPLIVNGTGAPPYVTLKVNPAVASIG